MENIETENKIYTAKLYKEKIQESEYPDEVEKLLDLYFEDPQNELLEAIESNFPIEIIKEIAGKVAVLNYQEEQNLINKAHINPAIIFSGIGISIIAAYLWHVKENESIIVTIVPCLFATTAIFIMLGAFKNFCVLVFESVKSTSKKIEKQVKTFYQKLNTSDKVKLFIFFIVLISSLFIFQFCFRYEYKVYKINHYPYSYMLKVDKLSGKYIMLKPENIQERKYY